MILLAMLLPLAVLQVDEIASPGSPTAWVRAAMEANPLESNHRLELDLVRARPGQQDERPISLSVAWNEHRDYEIRIRFNDEWVPMVACRDTVCIVDGQHAFERDWLERYEIDYEALPTPPEFDETLHIAREMIQLLFRQALFPLHPFRESHIGSVWLHKRNTMLHDDIERDILVIVSEPADLLGDVLRPEGVIYMHHHLLIDRSSRRLVGIETYLDDELVIDTRWEWAEMPDNDGFDLVRASIESLEAGYEDTATVTMLSDNQILPDEVFADASIFDIEGAVVAWNEPRRPIPYWAIAGRYLPVFFAFLVGTLLVLVTILVLRLRARRPKPATG